MVDLSLQQDLRLNLDLLLSPRMLQMLKILSIPYSELVDQISKESEENVMLEVERTDEYVEFIRYLNSDRKIKKEADFEKMPGLENIGNVQKTLEEHLLNQLELEDLDPTTYDMAKLIIENIDDFGFVINYPHLREKNMRQFAVSKNAVDKALQIIQTFEPDGVGARDLKECLLIQTREYNFDNETLSDIIEQAIKNHLDDLANQNYEQVAKALGIAENGVLEIASFIKNNLSPNPAAAFNGETNHIIPSFAIEQTDKGYKLINLETSYGPKLNISAQYLTMLENPKTDSKTKDFLREKLKKAKSLMEDFSKRSETLEKIVRKIIETQQEFLLKGITWLNPLPQKQLADAFGLHPSTISRTVAAKYIQTPGGLFLLKTLCPRGPKGLTVARIKNMLAEIIKNEDKKAPLSDGQITKMMQARGAKIDRRTTAYYRKELKFPAYLERQVL